MDHVLPGQEISPFAKVPVLSAATCGFCQFFSETSFISLQRLHLESNPRLSMTWLLENICFNWKLSFLQLTVISTEKHLFAKTQNMHDHASAFMRLMVLFRRLTSWGLWCFWGEHLYELYGVYEETAFIRRVPLCSLWSSEESVCSGLDRNPLLFSFLSVRWELGKSKADTKL